MATTPLLISVEEYLHTVYRPDCDYVDGEVLERNMGELPHARLQKFLARFLETFEVSLSLEVLSEQRLQINSSRFRVPDIMVMRGITAEPRIVRDAPLLCVEVLSSEDRMKRIEERVADYASIGVSTCWVVDPWRRVTHTAGGNGLLREEKEALNVPGTPIAIHLTDIFGELDRLEALSRAQS